jgi:ElaB/YqjD/DUF883 family membrane-anchored ribosome-binding protein
VAATPQELPRNTVAFRWHKEQETTSMDARKDYSSRAEQMPGSSQGDAQATVSTQSSTSDSLTNAMGRLRDDIASLKETVARLASQASTEAGKTIREVGETVASQVGSAASSVAEAGSELAGSAKEQAKTLASELEAVARRNPLGALAGALLVGVLIGMMSRGRG